MWDTLWASLPGISGSRNGAAYTATLASRSHFTTLIEVLLMKSYEIARLCGASLTDKEVKD